MLEETCNASLAGNTKDSVQDFFYSPGISYSYTTLQQFKTPNRDHILYIHTFYKIHVVYESKKFAFGTSQEALNFEMI